MYIFMYIHVSYRRSLCCVFGSGNFTLCQAEWEVLGGLRPVARAVSPGFDGLRGLEKWSDNHPSVHIFSDSNRKFSGEFRYHLGLHIQIKGLIVGHEYCF